MKINPRRHRSDSIKAAIDTMKSVSHGVLEPPSYIILREEDRPYWEAIIKARASNTWTESDLVNAATMAKAQADIKKLQQSIDTDGYVINGKVNPAAKMVETLTRRVISLSRLLHVHALATVGRSADASKSLQLELDMRDALDQDDELIPRLRVV